MPIAGAARQRQSRCQPRSSLGLANRQQRNRRRQVVVAADDNEGPQIR
jgi:hypothetical protein